MDTATVGELVEVGGLIGVVTDGGDGYLTVEVVVAAEHVETAVPVVLGTA